MERKECRDDEPEHTGQDVGSHHEVGHFVVKRVGVAQGATNHGVAREDDQQAGHRAVKQHVQEELIVVKADAVCHPGAVMVHLEDAAIALGAVMAPVGLSLVTPLANTHAAVSLPFNGGLNADDRASIRVGACTGLLIGGARLGDERPC